MSTIPSIFSRDAGAEAEHLPYTVVGGKKKDRIRRFPHPLTILILSRTGRLYKDEFLEELQNLDFAEILCVEGPGQAYELEARARKYPTVRFLLLKTEVTDGQRINLGIGEASSSSVFVVWSDMKMVRDTIGIELAEKLRDVGSLCTVPIIKSFKGEIIPTFQVPGFLGKSLKVVAWKSLREGMRTLFPSDYCGLYDREKYQTLGGYDPQIANPYWQKMDFGFRCYLWGEEIVGSPLLQLSYVAEAPSEIITPDPSYKLHYLKNLAVRFTRNSGVLPWRRFFPYMLRSDTGPVYALREFQAARRWVRRNRRRYIQDARSLVSRWEHPE
jgi:hypothetical protein